MPRKIHLHSSLQSSSSWDFQSSSPTLTLRCDSQSLITTLSNSSQILQQWSDPLAALDWMSKSPGSNPTARWVGYLSYDLGRLFEPLATLATDDLHLPLFCFSLHEPAQGKNQLPSLVFDPAAAPASLDSASAKRLPHSSLAKADYLNCVARAIEYIRAGDIFQVNLSQRFTAPLPFNPLQIWQNLIRRSPAAYGAYLDCGDHVLLSNSPELFLRVNTDRAIITRPIKGTRPRLPGMEEELRSSIKDQAELNMIVDLERNDLGRVCKVGSVKVVEPRTVETHPTIYHGVATVGGELLDNVSFVDLLRATFPGGSITGAPKIRAMQIIEELEPLRRGPYCGAIGYLAADGSMQFNVAIRTMIVKNNQIYIPVGGGIVADSDPITEYEETLTKAVAMFGALDMSL